LRTCLIGNAARGLFDLPALEFLQDKRWVTIREVHMLDSDLRLLARLPVDSIKPL
jgi:hypothetical protein